MSDVDRRRPSTRVIAIIPVGRLDGAKSRLGAVLDAEERDDLARQLAERTIRAAVATPGLAEVLVVTPDDEVRELAVEAGARPLRQRSRGLNAGLREARDEAMAAGAEAVLVLPVDLPNVSPDTLGQLIESVGGGSGPLVVIVPDRHGRGTNALLLAPPDVIDFRFGGDSKAAHIEAGATVPGARIVVVQGPLTLDLDTPEDLLLSQALDATRSGGPGGG
ncbi:MAG TPA: 2-phospho-L-lactate guanylyltransferase [Candidatus Limnocylindrales bacterium]|nr:2-phospho-L-lactate guanylyltransferase [Candidatus Limnocylindrales bacterium]